MDLEHLDLVGQSPEDSPLASALGPVWSTLGAWVTSEHLWNFVTLCLKISEIHGGEKKESLNRKKNEKVPRTSKAA